MGFSRVDTSGITGLVYAIYLGSGLALLVDSSASLYWLLPLPLKSLPPWLFTELTTPTMRKDVEFAAMHAKRLAANYTPDQINLWRAAFLVVGQVVLVGVMESLSWGEKGDIVHAIVWIILFSNLHMHGDYANSRHTAGRPV